MMKHLFLWLDIHPIKTIIDIASTMGWTLHQMDVKTAFLNDNIEEEVYIEQPKGFIVHGK